MVQGYGCCAGRERSTTGICVKVTVIAASTICGRIGPGLIGSSLDRALLERMRARTDASLMGAETLRASDPEMRGPGGALPEKRVRAIITQSGDIPVSGKKIFSQGPPPLIFTSAAAANGLRSRLQGLGRIAVLPEGPCGLSLSAALDFLARQGVCSVLVEGGGRLNHSCFQEGVVDEVLLTITPKLSGDSGGPFFCGGQGGVGDPYLPLALVSCEVAQTGELFAHYRVSKKE